MDMGSWDNNQPTWGRGREGRGEGRRGPHLSSPKGAKQFFRPEDAPLYLERGNYEQTNNKQNLQKIHKCSMSTKKRLFLGFFLLVAHLIKRLAYITKECKCRIDQ
jgi:hypothetical protein